MTSLNCKPGDLAIVTNSEQPQNLGQIVEVLGTQTGVPFAITGRGHVWQVRAVGGRATLFYRLSANGGSTVLHCEGPAPDRCLRPVSGLTDGDAVVMAIGEGRAIEGSTQVVHAADLPHADA